MKVKVIRVIQYEGEESAVRACLSKSLPLGKKVLSGYAITVAEHHNDMPKQLKLSAEDVSCALNKEVENDQVS